jgi:hypothetical protein
MDQDMTDLYPWQENLLKKISGVKPGEMTVMSAGRQTGKSHFTAQALKRLMDDLQAQPITNLVLTEGKVYGARYYCVEPVGGNWREMEDWCIQICGESTGSIWAEQVNKTTPQPGERWYANNRKFWFREEKDRTMFVLKWR